MKKIILAAMLFAAVTGLFAESVPQPAFRLLDGYLDKRAADAEYGAKVGPWILIGTGAVLAAGSATVWYGGDSISQSSSGSPMNPTVKGYVATGLALGAVTAIGLAAALRFFPPAIDERVQYSAIYHETDPVLQEEMAVARLKGMAQNAHDGRIVGGWVNLGLSGASVVIQILYNHDRGRPWGSGVFDTWGWSLGSFVGGTTALLVRSPEETLYEEYLYIVSRGSKN